MPTEKPQAFVSDVVAVQVVPIVEKGKEIKIQSEGVNEDTTAYSLYLRHKNGEAVWVADIAKNYPMAAMSFATTLASMHHAVIESNSFTEAYAYNPNRKN